MPPLVLYFLCFQPGSSIYACSHQLHLQSIRRILRYMNGTKNNCLHFQATNSTSLLAYFDAGWMSNNDDNRFQYGFVIFHGSNLISATCQKQWAVARSST